jgi:hypothetical protein
MSAATQSSLIPASSSALVQPVDLPSALLDLGLAIPGQVAQLPDRLGRYEVGAQQPGLDQPAQPLRIANIGLAARHLLDVPRVDQQTLELVLQDRPRRLPIHAAGLHRHVGDPKRGQPIAEPQKPRHRRSELLHMLLAGNSHARRHRRLIHIQSRRALDHCLH